MAISGFGRRKEDFSGAATPSSASGSSSSGVAAGGMGNLTAFIDQGSDFEGKLSFKDTVRIDGNFSGEISSDNTLIVGESGQIQATIHSVCVVISGLVEGDIHASEEIVLHKTAVVSGDLNAPTIMMEEGAQLNGTVRMGRVAKVGADSTQKANPNAGGQEQKSDAGGKGATPDKAPSS
jgi:cytoskeletal protein CcmA (bactofilin family)